MKLLVCSIMITCALLVNAQTTNVPARVADEEEEKDETSGQTAAPQTVSPATDSTSNALPSPPPPQDPAKCMIAHFTFDDNLQANAGSSGMVEAAFKRPSTAYRDGSVVTENSPRFVEGRSGKALLLESGYANLFSASQSGAGEANAFYPLQGATLSISVDRPWQGKECLAISTKGEQVEEGFSLETAVEKAFYAKEDLAKSPAIVPAYYVASVYLRGDGNLKITLKDSAGNEQSEPVYASLSPDWQRFSCMFGYKFPRLNIGDKHDGDWRNSLPTGTNIEAKLQLICATVDNQKLNFFADGFQLEKRHLASGNTREISPHAWMPGASQTAREQFAVNVKDAALNAWKKHGSIAFWFKPSWEAGDGSAEIILQMPINQCLLAHNDNKIAFSPAGVAFMPSDWKNIWHHLAITWNEAGERVLYVDGMDYPNAAGEVIPLKNPDCIMMGDLAKNIAPNGAVDELTLYSMTLTSDQVKQFSSVEAQPAKTTAPAQPPVLTPALTPTAMDQKPASTSTNADSEEENE